MGDDWLTDRAESLFDEHEGEIEISMATFIELFLVEEWFAFDRERAVTAILELATYSGNPDVVYQTSENVAAGLNTFDAFHAALAGGAIVSSDRAYDALDGVERIRLEPDGDGTTDERLVPPGIEGPRSASQPATQRSRT